MLGEIFNQTGGATARKNLIDRFDEIYRRNINDASIRMDDVMFILGLYQTRATNTSVANPIYWRLYNEVLNRIDKGVWSVHPQMWSTYLKDSVDTEFSDAHRKVSMSKLDDKYIGVLRNKGIANDAKAWRTLIHHWITSKYGYRDMLETTRVFIDIYTVTLDADRG